MSATQKRKKRHRRTQSNCYTFTIHTIRAFGESLSARPWSTGKGKPDLRVIQEAAALGLGLFEYLSTYPDSDVDEQINAEHSDRKLFGQRENIAVRAWLSSVQPLVHEIARAWPTCPPSAACLQLVETAHAAELAIEEVGSEFCVQALDVVAKRHDLDSAADDPERTLYKLAGEKIRACLEG